MASLPPPPYGEEKAPQAPDQFRRHPCGRRRRRHQRLVRLLLTGVGLTLALLFVFRPDAIVEPSRQAYRYVYPSASQITYTAAQEAEALELLAAAIDPQVRSRHADVNRGGDSSASANGGGQKPLPPKRGKHQTERWLLSELQHMANGLAGREMEFYDLVRDNRWLGGPVEYSALNEALPYWFNGLVALAYGVGDPRLKGQVLTASAYVLERQTEDGWLGPEEGEQCDSAQLWARFPMALGWMQLADAEPDAAPQIVAALLKFVKHAHRLLADGKHRREPWGRARYADMTIVLQWLLERHSHDDAATVDLLRDTMSRLRATGIDWAGFFSRERFPFIDLDTLPVQVTEPLFPYLHAVNTAQGLKAPAVDYRWLRNASLAEAAFDAARWTLRYHGSASGSLLGDERLAGLAPNRGSELCTTVEAMHSLSYAHQLLGRPELADAVERAAFNALPGAFTPNHWAHQYISVPNQPWSTPNFQPRGLWWNVGHEAPTFGVAPNYPCCAVNFPQGWPKLLSASFALLGNGDGNDNAAYNRGVVHNQLVPAAVDTILPGRGGSSGPHVKVECETNYPFGTILSYRVSANGPFTLAIRLPGFTAPLQSPHSFSLSSESKVALPEVSVDGRPLSLIHEEAASSSSSSSSSSSPAAWPTSAAAIPGFLFDPSTALLSLRLPALPSLNVKLHLPEPRLRVEARANDTVAVLAGSILYALDVGQSSVQVPAIVANAPPQASTVYYANTTAWNVAIDPDSLELHRGYDVENPPPDELPIEDGGYGDSSRHHHHDDHHHEHRGGKCVKKERHDDDDKKKKKRKEKEPKKAADPDTDPLPSPLWGYRATPSYVTARGCPIDWPLSHTIPGPVPLADDGDGKKIRTCVGPEVTVVLRPYGSLRSHMADLPIVRLGKGGKGGKGREKEQQQRGQRQDRLQDPMGDVEL